MLKEEQIVKLLSAGVLAEDSLSPALYETLPRLTRDSLFISGRRCGSPGRVIR
jgi:hypothetical protein